MMKKQCPRCGKIYNENEKFCKTCGVALGPVQVKKQNNTTVIILACVAAVLVIACIVTAYFVITGAMGGSHNEDEWAADQDLYTQEPQAETASPVPTATAVPTPTPTPTPSPTPTPVVTPTPVPATVYSGGGEYIIPDSSTRYLSMGDLVGLNKTQLRYARNEIYARHGRMFDDPQLQAYFNARSWYRGTIPPQSFSENMLSQLERSNVALIQSAEGN